jgi:adenosylhomocysteinase
MALEKYFSSPAHLKEKETLPVIQALIDRYIVEQPFRGLRVVFAHLLVRNTMAVVEALVRGGADLVISEGFQSPATEEVTREIKTLGVPILSIPEAVKQGDLYFDTNAMLGRHKTPAMAVEVTRTGVHHYRQIPCPVVSADNCRAKKIEGFYGTGDGFVRAWRQLRPEDPLKGKQVVQFGYGKIGRGAAHVIRRAGCQVAVVDTDAAARARAQEDGFPVIDGSPNPALQAALAETQIVLMVTGIPSVLSQVLSPEWMRANRPKLVNLGAEDEFGPLYRDEEILGGRAAPLNFHLAQPTLNRYVGVTLAAHLMAFEALIAGDYPVGIHPLPVEMDDWLLKQWRQSWPDIDLTGIQEELGIK